MKTICARCGHEQERKSWAKTQQRCTICHSRKFTTLDMTNGASMERVNNITDSRKIGTFEDIYMPPSSKAKVKKENIELNEWRKERRERWRKNELLHQRGRREQTGLIREVVQFIGSMVSEKNPKGHGSKAIQHAFNIAEIKRTINDEGGDTRLLGENTRKLTGDNDSILGLGFLKFGKGGILGRFRRNE